MAVDAGSIFSEVRVELDKLNGDLRKVEARFDQFEKNNKETTNEVEKSWTSSFNQINLAGVAAFAAIGLAVKGSITTFADFEQAIANVGSVTGGTSEELQALEQAALEAGQTTRFTATEAANALYNLASAGLDSAESVNALNGVLELAGATQSDLAQTSAVVTATLSQFSLDASEAGDVANVFAAAIANSQANLTKLQNAFRQVGPVAGALNISLEETTGALQALFDAGFQGEQAGTALRNVLGSLANEADPTVKKLKDLGLSFEDLNPEINGLIDIIGNLNEANLSAGDIIAAFGREAGPQLLSLLETGRDGLIEYTQAVTDTNAAAEAYAKQNDTLQGSLDLFQSALESAQINLVKEFAPAIRGVVDLATGFINVLDSLPGPVKVFIGTLAAGIPIVTGLGIAFTTLSGLLVSLGGPISIVVGGIALLAAAYASIKGAQDSFEKQADAIKDERKEINTLVDEYKKLKSQTSLNNEERDKLLQLETKLKAIFGDNVLKLNEYTGELELNTDAINERNKKLLEQEDIELQSIQKRKQANIDSRNQSISAVEKEISRLKDQQKQYSSNQLVLDRISISITNSENTIIEKVKERTKFEKEIESIRKRRAVISKEIYDIENPGEAQAKKDAQEKLEADKKQLEELNKKKKAQDEIYPALLRSLENVTKAQQIGAFTEKEALETQIKLISDYIAKLQERAIEKGDLNSTELEQLNTLIDRENDLNKQLESINKTKKDGANDDKDNFKNQIDYVSQYDDKLKELNATELGLIELNRQRAIAEVESSNASIEAKQLAIEKINEYYDAIRDNTAFEQAAENVQTFADIASTVFNALGDTIKAVYSSITRDRLALLDEQLQAELEANGVAEQSTLDRLRAELEEAISNGDTETAEQLKQEIKREEIKKKFEKQRAQIEYKAALEAWQLQLALAIATGQLAILGGLATQPFIPAGIIAGAKATVLQAAAIAVVASQMPRKPAANFQTGGIVIPTSSPQGTLVNVAENGSPELLLNGGNSGRAFLNEFASAIGEQISNRQVSGSSNGGTIQLQLNIDGRRVAESTARYLNNGLVRLDI